MADGSCAHIAAVEHLTGKWSIDDKMATIPSAHQRGARGEVPAVGYSARFPKDTSKPVERPVDKLGQ